MGLDGIPTRESQHRQPVLKSKAMPLAAGPSTPFKEVPGEVLGPGRGEASGHGKPELLIMSVIRSDRPSAHKTEVSFQALR